MLQKRLCLYLGGQQSYIVCSPSPPSHITCQSWGLGSHLHPHGNIVAPYFTSSAKLCWLPLLPNSKKIFHQSSFNFLCNSRCCNYCFLIFWFFCVRLEVVVVRKNIPTLCSVHQQLLATSALEIFAETDQSHRRSVFSWQIMHPVWPLCKLHTWEKSKNYCGAFQHRSLQRGDVEQPRIDKVGLRVFLYKWRDLTFLL